jgi:hypothetical protein
MVNRKYQELQEKFDGLHEMIYGMKDHVNNSNDVIDEFSKLFFWRPSGFIILNID